MEHDEMAIVENTFCQRFPVEKQKATVMLIRLAELDKVQYKLVDGESGRIL